MFHPRELLDEHIALVTGGASGIGRATSSLFASHGCHVLVADQDTAAGIALVEEINARPNVAHKDAVFVETDVTDPDQVQRMVDTVVDRFGGLDIAVNNAGTSGTYAKLSDQPLDDWQRTIAVNLTSVFLCMQAEVAAMQASPTGQLDREEDGWDAWTPPGRDRSIVNVASAAGLIGFANLPAYVASKHGVVGLTKSIALEYARRGIRINAVCPGTVRTPMLRGFAGSDEAIDAMAAPSPIGRAAEPTEIAQAIVWLCSPTASYVTGQALAVDGGVLAT